MKLRRAILIYLLAIGVPVCGLVWLGLQSFERQRQALSALRAEKLAAEVERRERAAAEAALAKQAGPVALHFFLIESGKVVKPALTSSLPDQLPIQFREAEGLESAGAFEKALAIYTRLFSAGDRPSLALSRMARCMEKLGREREAREAWKKLALQYSGQRDLSHRPYGIVAAIAAGETQGLADRIVKGEWELPAEEAEYFLGELGAASSNRYLDRFRMARALAEHFHPVAAPKEGELYSQSVAGFSIYYRAAGPDRYEGMAVDPEWTNLALRQVEREMGLAGGAQKEVVVYGAAIALVLLVLFAGLALLLRDVAREGRASRVRADFVSGVSHELKTPIALIRLYGDTLLERPELTAREREESYRIIVREAERLTHLVNQVMTFSRVERGAQRYELKTGDLAPVVERLLDEYDQFASRSGFTLHRSVAKSCPPVGFDSGAVTQALTNLLDNALKYSGERREIEVRLSAVEDHVIFEVEDHGYGIPSEEQSKIFDRFYRVSNGSGKGGYGLGLFLVQHIMQAHGGRVEVESEPGKGSTFRLIFPLAGVEARV